MKSPVRNKVKGHRPGILPAKRAVLNFLLCMVCFSALVPTVGAQESQHQKVRIPVGAVTREFTLYVPAQLPANAPLLLSFAGMNQTDDFQADQAKYWMVADTAKFIVVYPRAVNPNASWDMTGPSDLEFTSAIIDTIYSRYAIDKTRVYASGFSWGANFCYRIANSMADKIAAIAPTMGHSWGPNPNVAASARPMPVLQVMGTVDDVFKLENVQPVLDKWIAHNGCNTRARTTEPYPASRSSSQAVKKLWINTTTKVEVVLLTTPKGHWHSNDPAHIMVNQEVWDFCKRYSTAGLIVSSVDAVEQPGRPVISREVFNLSGVRLNVPADDSTPAVYIVRDRLSDGSIKSYKMIANN